MAQHQGDPKTQADAPPTMAEADAANGEPDALEGAKPTATPRSGKPAVGERQAAENRENESPG